MEGERSERRVTVAYRPAPLIAKGKVPVLSSSGPKEVISLHNKEADVGSSRAVKHGALALEGLLAVVYEDAEDRTEEKYRQSKSTAQDLPPCGSVLNAERIAVEQVRET